MTYYLYAGELSVFNGLNRMMMFTAADEQKVLAATSRFPIACPLTDPGDCTFWAKVDA